jgi:hypothetical protein
MKMKTEDALAHFNGNGAKVAEAARVSRQAVHKWGEYVPEISAYYIALATAGALVFDEESYKRRARA